MRNRLDKQWLDLTNITKHWGVSQEIWIGWVFLSVCFCSRCFYAGSFRQIKTGNVFRISRIWKPANKNENGRNVTDSLHFADLRRKQRLSILARDWYRPQDPLFTLTSVITATQETYGWMKSKTVGSLIGYKQHNAAGHVWCGCIFYSVFSFFSHM